MKSKVFGFIFLCLLAPCFAQAQDSEGVAASEQEIQDLQNLLNGAMNEAINNVVNGLVLFGSQRSVSSGVFTQKNEADPDEHLDVSKLGFELPIGDRKQQLVPYVSGNVGIVRLTNDIPTPSEEFGENDFSSTKSISVSLGGGAIYTPVENLSFQGGFEIAYSRIENRYDYNNVISNIFLRGLLDKKSLNWDIDMLSYTPSIKALYVIPIDEYSINLSLRYAHMFNDSYDSTTNGTLEIDSDTGLFQSRVEGVAPLLGYKICEDPIMTRLYFQRNDIYGDLRNDGDMDFFYEVGLDIFANTTESSSIFSEIGLGIGYIYRNDFEGWTAGLLLDF